MPKILGILATAALLYEALPRDVNDLIQRPDLTWFIIAVPFCLLLGLAVTLAVKALFWLITVAWID